MNADTRKVKESKPNATPIPVILGTLSVVAGVLNKVIKIPAITGPRNTLICTVPCTIAFPVWSNDCGMIRGTIDWLAGK